MKIISQNSLAQERFEFFIDVNSEKYKDKPITIFCDRVCTLEELSINPINIMILNEPNELFGLCDWVIQNKNSFQNNLYSRKKILFYQIYNNIINIF